MNHPIHWLYQQFVGVIPQGAAQCYLCGVSCPEQHTVAKGIAETFNSHYLAQCPSSPWLCAACQWYFDGKANHPDFRKMSLIVQRNAWQDWERRLMKPYIQHFLQEGVSDDAYLIVSLSKKKHILLQAPLNLKGSKTLAIQVEEQVAHLELWHWKHMDICFMRLLELGHNKGEILSGNFYGNTLRKHGELAEVLYLSQQLNPYRNSPQLELLSYVTIMEESNGDTTGNGDGQDSGNAPESRMESDQSRVQEQVSHGHLEPGGKQRSGMCPDVEHASQVSKPTLWEV